MSNIYIQEPPTNGKVLLKTTVGDIDIELWSKEAPLACKNFIQLCLDGYYDNCKFHRLVKGFIVQTGDPSGTGFGGESIYGKPFKDEFHSRLRFVRRGLVAMANGGEKDDNGSQFFFTLESAPELQNKHTIFGKVAGKTLYNMLKLGEGDVDRNERPLYPHKIISAEILNNPFPELEPRIRKSKKMKIEDPTKREQTKEEIKKKSKNFALLSFGEEAEQEEEEIVKISKEFKNKSKSSHDLLKNDDKLSSIPVVNTDELSMSNSGDEDCQDSKDDDMEKRLRLSNVKEKLNAKNKFSQTKKENTNLEDDIDEAVDCFGGEQSFKKIEKIEKAKDEFRKLQKQILKDTKKMLGKQETEKSDPDNKTLNEFVVEANRFKEKSQKIKKKGQDREEQCWEMLEKFQNRLKSSKQNKNNEDGVVEESSDHKDSWLIHRMQCTGDDEIVLARDANIRNEEDWFDIHDPRNPINQRKRNENDLGRNRKFK